MPDIPILYNGPGDAHPSGDKKVKVAHTRLPSVGFRSWSRFLAVSLQVTWVINSAVGCHYFPQLPSQEGCYQFRFLVNKGTMDVNSLPKTVTRQRRGCDLNTGTSAPESSTLTTRLPDAPRQKNARSRGGSGPPPNPWFIGSTQVHNRNSISIGSAVLVQLLVVTNGHADTDHRTSVTIGRILYALHSHAS